jgi:acyl-CoA synthetase (AMP-forming)/AMP-acid ligase II
MSTVHAAFTKVAAGRGDAEFLRVESVTAAAYAIDAGPRSWREVAAEVERLRLAYVQAGYGHGHRVGLLLENRPAFFTHWLALNAIGASAVPIHADMRSADWVHLIGQSEMCLAVTLPEREADLRSAASQAHVPMHTIRPEVPGRIPPARIAARLVKVEIGRGSECAVLYTAGASGRPKGCRLSNGYFLRAGEWSLGLGDLAAVRADVERVITPLPLSHMNAMAFSSMAVILSGGCLIQLDRFHPSTWWQSVRESRATIAHTLGAMPTRLLAAPPGEADRDHALRFAVGAGVDRRDHAAFEERFGVPLLEAWSMTETGAAACIMANSEPRHVGTNCFGRAESFVETRIVNDQGADAAADEPGELRVRAAGDDPRRDFFLGYLKDDEATEAAWAGGWFHSGDVVSRSAEGDFHFVDRKKSLIHRGRKVISPVEVESVLARHPAVASCAVAATRDPVRGEEVLACVVLRPSSAAPAPEHIAASIVAHALERLPYYKVPGYVAFVEALPVTLAQKIQRAELRELAKALPDRSNCIDTRKLKRRRKE